MSRTTYRKISSPKLAIDYDDSIAVLDSYEMSKIVREMQTKRCVLKNICVLVHSSPYPQIKTSHYNVSLDSFKPNPGLKKKYEGALNDWISESMGIIRSKSIEDICREYVYVFDLVLNKNEEENLRTKLDKQFCEKKHTSLDVLLKELVKNYSKLQALFATSEFLQCVYYFLQNQWRDADVLPLKQQGWTRHIFVEFVGIVDNCVAATSSSKLEVFDQNLSHLIQNWVQKQESKSSLNDKMIGFYTQQMQCLPSMFNTSKSLQDAIECWGDESRFEIPILLDCDNPLSKGSIKTKKIIDRSFYDIDSKLMLWIRQCRLETKNITERCRLSSSKREDDNHTFSYDDFNWKDCRVRDFGGYGTVVTCFWKFAHAADLSSENCSEDDKSKFACSDKVRRNSIGGIVGIKKLQNIPSRVAIKIQPFNRNTNTCWMRRRELDLHRLLKSPCKKCHYDFKLQKISGSMMICATLFEEEAILDEFKSPLPKAMSYVMSRFGFTKATLESRFGRNMPVLDSSNIVDLYGSLFVDNTVCTVMPFYSGGNFAQLFKGNESERGPSLYETIRCFSDACHALAYMCHRNVVHGDVKPHNMFLNKERRLVIGDFGLSSILGCPTSNLVGTHQFYPDIWIKFAGKTVDTFKFESNFSDIYALGSIMYSAFVSSEKFKLTRWPEHISEMNYDSVAYMGCYYKKSMVGDDVSEELVDRLKIGVLKTMEVNEEDAIPHYAYPLLDKEMIEYILEDVVYLIEELTCLDPFLNSISSKKSVTFDNDKSRYYLVDVLIRLKMILAAIDLWLEKSTDAVFI